jgi:uncharacterized protein (DUF2147 family)
MRCLTSLFSLYCFIAALVMPGMAMAAEEDLLGRWTTHKGGQIDFTRCGPHICGHVAKLARPDHEAPPTDRKNPKKALRDVPLLGLQIFSNFTYKGNDRWNDGAIYNVENGKTYDSKLRLFSPSELKLSGCVFIFCRSYRWHRTADQKDVI